jgi:hypothetical protein
MITESPKYVSKRNPEITRGVVVLLDKRLLDFRKERIAFPGFFL